VIINSFGHSDIMKHDA